MSESRQPRDGRGSRDFWQLHVPLALVLLLCVVLTVVEVRRATEGVWRAWIYMVEWPLIAVVAVWIWHRYRTEGSVTQGLVERWKERVAEYAAAAQGDPDEASEPTQVHPDPDPDLDPELEAWKSYVADVERRQSPGRPPDVTPPHSR